MGVWFLLVCVVALLIFVPLAARWERRRTDAEIDQKLRWMGMLD